MYKLEDVSPKPFVEWILKPGQNRTLIPICCEGMGFGLCLGF